MYFKNLDGLRFLAALFVIVGHCQHVLFDPPVHIRAYSPWAEKLAGFGVDFFFVLISFLLIKELAETGTIKIKKFYIRRTLRLWPLYFIVGILGLLTAEPILRWLGMVNRAPTPHELIANFGFLFTFTINFQTLLGKMNEFSSPILGHFWSLAVEEQFYLVCAPLLVFFRNKTLTIILLMCGIGYCFNIYQPAIFDIWFKENAWSSPIFFPINRFFHFGLGALLAWLVQRNHLMELPPFVSWIVQIAFFIPMCNYLFGHHFYPIAPERIINGLLSFGIILMAFAKNSLLPFEIKWMKYFGKVSFGIYIFHMFAIRVSFKLLSDAGLNTQSLLFQIALPILASFIAIGLATLSYEKIEKRFLALKNRYN